LEEVMGVVTGEVTGELFDLIGPAVGALGLDLVDVELMGGVARVVLDRSGGIDLDALGEATRMVSALLDAHDPVPGQRYTLEVTSPGLERPLRRPEHFMRAVGSLVSVRTKPGAVGDRRLRGVLVSADDTGITVHTDDPMEAEHRIAYEELDRARTVFEWPAPRQRSGAGNVAAETGLR
jgi:ribosome maturation factor RimP